MENNQKNMSALKEGIVDMSPINKGIIAVIFGGFSMYLNFSFMVTMAYLADINKMIPFSGWFFSFECSAAAIYLGIQARKGDINARKFGLAGVIMGIIGVVGVVFNLLTVFIFPAGLPN